MAKENCIRLAKHYKAIGRTDLLEDIKKSYFNTYKEELIFEDAPVKKK